MRRLLLATTAISALALAAPVVLAQSSNAPSGAYEGQKQPPAKGGKTAAPTTPGEATHNGSPAGHSAQAPAAPPNGAKHPTSQAQQQGEPNAQPPKGQPRPRQAQQEPPGVQQPKGQPQPHQAQQEPPSVQQPKGEHRMNGQAQTPGTTGETNTAPRNAGGNHQRPAAATRTDEGNRSGAGNAGGRREVQVTEQQRSRIHERAGHLRTQRLDRADFSMEVGAPMPRSVRVYMLPPEIVEIVPEYRGYDYVMVGDDIVIIDPDSHEIVAVIPP